MLTLIITHRNMLPESAENSHLLTCQIDFLTCKHVQDSIGPQSAHALHGLLSQGLNHVPHWQLTKDEVVRAYYDFVNNLVQALSKRYHVPVHVHNLMLHVTHSWLWSHPIMHTAMHAQQLMPHTPDAPILSDITAMCQRLSQKTCIIIEVDKSPALTIFPHITPTQLQTVWHGSCKDLCRLEAGLLYTWLYLNFIQPGYPMYCPHPLYWPSHCSNVQTYSELPLRQLAVSNSQVIDLFSNKVSHKEHTSVQI